MLIYYMPDDCQEMFEYDTASEGWCIYREREQAALAELCAEHYCDWHDGWKSNWPLEISLYDELETFVAKFKVEQEHEPVYHAIPI